MLDSRIKINSNKDADDIKQTKEMVFFDGLEIEKSIYDKYHNITYMTGQFMKDIELFTELFNGIAESKSNFGDIEALEYYRLLRAGTLQGRGIYYSEDKFKFLSLHPKLRQSSIPMYSNKVMDGRYLIPIRNFCGDVITFMGYYIPDEDEAPNSYEPYEVPNVPWAKQSRLLGNLETLNKFPNNPLKLLFVTEGFTDAFRIEETLHLPAICDFGSSLYKLKKASLYLLKQMGYYLIYVYDRDTAGETPQLLNDPIWDNLMTFPEEKDIDFYVSWYYINRVAKEDKHPDYQVPINDNYWIDLIKTFHLHKTFNPVFGADLSSYIQFIDKQ